MIESFLSLTLHFWIVLYVLNNRNLLHPKQTMNNPGGHIILRAFYKSIVKQND